MSVKSLVEVYGEAEEDLCPHNLSSKTSTKGAVATEAGSLVQYLKDFTEKPILSYGYGSNLAVRMSFLGRTK